MAAAVALAGEMVMDVAGQVGFEFRIGIALLATVTEVRIWVFRNTLKKKKSLHVSWYLNFKAYSWY